MSRTYEIGCEKCRVCLWIGQGRLLEKFGIYTAPKKASLFSKFLREHIDHPLKFFDTERRDDDYVEIDENDASVDEQNETETQK